MFKAFCERIFAQPDSFWTMLTSPLNLLANLVTDSRYDSSVLDQTLQEAFGSRRLFTSNPEQGAGTRIAVTASRVSDGKLCLFTNYRRVSRSTDPSAYQLLVPRAGCEEPRLWEVYVSDPAQ
jgi:hypothetical protein